jgi:hypothetical protein
LPSCPLVFACCPGPPDSSQIAELRALIGATPDAGYLLGSESPPRAPGLFGLWRRASASAASAATVVVQLRRSQLEAAARLWMGEQFDGNQLDALFVCLEVRACCIESLAGSDRMRLCFDRCSNLSEFSCARAALRAMRTEYQTGLIVRLRDVDRSPAPLSLLELRRSAYNRY